MAGYLNYDTLHVHSSNLLLQESQLLIVSLPFHDIRQSTTAIARNVQLITDFLLFAPQSRFVFLFQTHSDPSDGYLQFSDNKSTDLSEVGI